MRNLALPTVWGIVTAALVSACGGSAPHTRTTPSSASSVPLPDSEPLPATSLYRTDVHAAVVAGVGAFLQHVDLDVDHPVMQDGKFYGFRINALVGDPSFWRGVDLRPGDVVTHVNGFSVGTPDDAQKALSSLDVSSEAKVEYDRDGKPGELRYAIVDDDAQMGAPLPMPSATPTPPTTPAPAATTAPVTTSKASTPAPQPKTTPTSKSGS